MPSNRLPSALEPPPPMAWNVLVTSREGGQRRLRRALSRVKRLQRSGYRNVLLGEVDDVPAFLDSVAQRCAEQPLLSQWLGRVVPVEHIFPVDTHGFDASLRLACEPLLDRIAGQTFHVRVSRRGQKGIISTHEAEQALGAFIYDTLAANGRLPVVKFRDPDVIVAIEVVGEMVGIGLITRKMREEFPFVRVD